MRATAVNRIGARLVGIRPASAGTLGVPAGLAARRRLRHPDRAGHDDVLRFRFLIGLKAFVGAIIGGLVSYPVTAVGALLVGILESFASFWNSAFKEVIVFTSSFRCCSGARCRLR